MKTRRTDDPDIYFMSTDGGVPLWCYGIVEWKIDMRGGKFLMTPIHRDGSEGPIADATEMWKTVLQEKRR